jgi:hypothetical protein
MNIKQRAALISIKLMGNFFVFLFKFKVTILFVSILLYLLISGLNVYENNIRINRIEQINKIVDQFRFIKTYDLVTERFFNVLLLLNKKIVSVNSSNHENYFQYTKIIDGESVLFSSRGYQYILFPNAIVFPWGNEHLSVNNHLPDYYWMTEDDIIDLHLVQSNREFQQINGRECNDNRNECMYFFDNYYQLPIWYYWIEAPVTNYWPISQPTIKNP